MSMGDGNTPRSDRTLILASASPRRAELLRAAGIAFDVVVADVDERLLPDEPPRAYVLRLATAKAAAVAGRVAARPILGADTVVVVDGQILGKPRDRADARRMLRLLAGRSHLVLTGVCLRCGEQMCRDVDLTTVTFGPMSEAEVRWYVASGEPDDKAGAYAIQGLASRFVTRIDGSYANVVGLPVAIVARMLEAIGGDARRTPAAPAEPVGGPAAS